MDHNRIRVLRALRLKGRVTAADLPSATGLSDEQCVALIDELTSEGHVEEARGRLKLSAGGREHLTALLEQERAGLDQPVLADLYEKFDEHNSALKALMARWQLKAADTPNDHSDAAYDGAVVADLAGVDGTFQPLLARIVEAAPRLSHYPQRLSAALARVQAGDHSWFAKPLIDSYHTVWFELHEDLIGLAGLSRVEEAAAGRAE
jgi:hypothetical protein